ncbi:MAG: ABC transporter ATP-binding protein [Rhodothermia bacterium]|nr:MAG: ABC transporter ATP-binding protein [Rhodothermia bacterium]
MSVQTDHIIRLVNLRKSFGRYEVLKGVDLDVMRGRSVVVMGGSGTGKSVLIKHIVRLLEPDSGEVWVQGKRIDLLEKDELDELRLNIGYLFQSGALFDSMTAAQNLDFILDRHTVMSKAERRDRIDEILSWFDLVDKRAHFPSELSGGQKKRIALARAIVLEPEILLYDEPTTGLDPESVRTVAELIVSLREERGITSVAITHDILCAEIIADDAFFLHDGRIIAGGSLDEVRAFDHPQVRNFYGQPLLNRPTTRL